MEDKKKKYAYWMRPSMVAVEQSIQNNLTAAFNEVDEDTMARLRNTCAGEVAQLNGVIAFEDAYEWQRGE